MAQVVSLLGSSFGSSGWTVDTKTGQIYYPTISTAPKPPPTTTTIVQPKLSPASYSPTTSQPAAKTVYTPPPTSVPLPPAPSKPPVPTAVAPLPVDATPSAPSAPQPEEQPTAGPRAEIV